MTALSAWACLTALPAAAQGVIIESSSSAYARGDILAPGDQVQLSPGEEIIILDQSGDIARFDASGPYGTAGLREASAAASEVNVVEVAIWNARRADIGGTREPDYEACLKAAETRAGLRPEDCEAFDRNAVDPPSLELGFLGSRETRRPGESMRLRFRASFDAAITCTLQGGTADRHVRRVPLGRATAGAMRLNSRTLAYAPQPGGDTIPAPMTEGEYTLSCIAVDFHSVRDFCPAEGSMPDLASRDVTLVRFARLRQRPVAFAELTFAVTED